MTDPMELVGRLEDQSFRGPMQHLRDWSELDRLHTEAAACIREMVEAQAALGARLDRTMAIIGSRYAEKAGLTETLPLPLPPAPGAEDE